jgi:hypothetical protein
MKKMHVGSYVVKASIISGAELAESDLGREKVGKRRKQQASELRDADSCRRNRLCQVLAWLLFAIVQGEH